MSRTGVSAEDVGRFADVTDVALSHDGQHVAVTVSVPNLEQNRYRTDVLVGRTDVDVDPACAGTEDTRFTIADPAAAGATRMPRWAPASDRLAVVVNGVDGCGIHLVDVNTRQSQPVLASWPDPIEELTWAPDGTRLLFVVREPTDRTWYETPEERRPPLRLTALGYRTDRIGWTVNRPRLGYLLDITTGQPPRRLSTGEFDDAEFSWHPDSRSVYFVSQRHSRSDRSPINDVFTQDLDGEPRRLTDTTLCYGTPIPSPDGERLAFTTLDITGYPAATHLAVLELATGQVTDLTRELDRDCLGSSIRWLDSATVAVIVEDAGEMQVRCFDVTAVHSPRVLLGGPRRVSAFDACAGRLALVTSDPVHPPAVAVLAADGTEQLRHDPNATLASQRNLYRPQYTAVPVAPEVTVDSWLVLPAASDPDDDSEPRDGARAIYPLILWLQGGGAQYGYQFSHELQLLVGAGYAVLYANPRGSAGYGTAWMRTVAGPNAAVPGSGYAGDKIADLAAVVRATLAGHPELDPDRVGVMGGSGGALATTHLLAQTDLFRAGWAERGPYNLYSDAGTKDEAPWFFLAYLGSSHLDDPAAYWLGSPLRLVEHITAPLMIVHSEEDRRCSIGQAEELFMAMKLLDRDVEFVRFPGECHELTRSGRPVHRRQRLEILLEWFGRQLCGQADVGRV